jgi:cytochrome c oxidase subunit I+III
VRTTVGYGLAALTLLGGVLLAVPLAIAGALDQPALALEYEPRDGVEALNAVAAVGAVIVGLAALLAVLAIGRQILGRGNDDEDLSDPWGGQTLEWSIASPPPRGNFGDDLAVVESAEPIFEDPGDPVAVSEESA